MIKGSVFQEELLGLILAMEYAAANNWTRLQLESNSSSAVHAFNNPSLIYIHLRNRWHNCTHRGLMVICSHIFWEENGCVDKFATLGHALIDTTWYIILPSFLLADFARGQEWATQLQLSLAFPGPFSFVHCCLFPSRVLAQSPSCKYFFLFLIILRIGKAIKDVSFCWVPTQLDASKSLEYLTFLLAF